MELPQIEKKENFWKETVKFILLALAIVIPVRIYVAQPFIVSGASMDPTFGNKQYLIVDQVTYKFEKPERDDVVIFRYPNNPKTFFIKRVIGLPGETITMTNGAITIKNKENPTGFSFADTHVAPERKSRENFSVTLSDTEYFVMGDNRRESLDSRSWGPLEEDYLVGRPLVRLYPLSKIQFFPGK